MRTFGDPGIYLKTDTEMPLSKKNSVWITVMVASLGYFVDIYDLQLFNIVSKQSIAALGITDQNLIDKYDYTLFLWQMHL
jgi:putative MFS transporter